MANLQVRNIPDDLHERLRRLARKNDRTIRSVVIAAVERELQWMEWDERFKQSRTTDPGVDAAAVIREERTRRDEDLDARIRH